MIIRNYHHGNPWSKPYYGLQHRIVGNMQYTIEEWASFTEACIFNLHSNTPFTPIIKTFRGANAAENAKTYLDRIADMESSVIYNVR